MACVLFAAICAFITSPGDAAERGELTVCETAGIRRFVYPVAAEISLDGIDENTKFRLLHDGKPTPAQFRKTDDGVSLDFDASFLPMESRVYTIEYGVDATPEPEPPPGMSVEEHDDHYIVRHTKYLEWKIRKDLRGFLESVKTPELEFMRPESAGFFVAPYDHEPIFIGADNSAARVASSRVAKNGPVQCALEFDVHIKRNDETLPSKIRLSFPRSKSWVEVDWSFDERMADLVEFGIDLNLDVTVAPTLVDFGAGSLVYAPLSPGQSALMLALPENGEQNWKVMRGPADQPEPYVVQSEAFPFPAEGWAHVMDQKRCTAISFADFGKGGDLIQVDADGRTLVGRSPFVDEAKLKSLKVWYHFVTMPMHVGAATSPQSMLYPLETDWKP
ncbi:MAG: hypothetical protein WEB58_16275 [Planctomycetaceae bacterium]